MNLYEELIKTCIFVPVAFESMGPICEETYQFIAELGRRLTAHTADSRKLPFFFKEYPRSFSTVTQSHSEAVSSTIPRFPPDCLSKNILNSLISEL